VTGGALLLGFRPLPTLKMLIRAAISSYPGETTGASNFH